MNKGSQLTSHRQRVVPIAGKDDLGRFIIGAGECINCQRTGICVKYAPKDFSLANFNIADVANTILKDTRNRVGITCGFYAKFHRQITHIYEKTQHKSFSKPPSGRREVKSHG